MEWVWYKPLNVHGESDDDKWLSAHYAAAIVPHTGKPQLIDLGLASDVDDLVADARRTISGRYANASQVLRKLDAKVMAPVRAHLPADTTHLFLSPDAKLNLVPFGTLIDETGDYLIQRWLLLCGVAFGRRRGKMC